MPQAELGRRYEIPFTWYDWEKRCHIRTETTIFDPEWQHWLVGPWVLVMVGELLPWADKWRPYKYRWWILQSGMSGRCVVVPQNDVRPLIEPSIYAHSLTRPMWD